MDKTKEDSELWALLKNSRCIHPGSRSVYWTVKETNINLSLNKTQYKSYREK
jgi:hypothetical protein